MPFIEDQKQTSRVEAFSDGVFAIAITLLILEIRVPPHDETAAGGGLLGALGHLWPSYLAFFMSFIVILVMWVNHHRIFTFVQRVDDAFLYWNGLLLMLVTTVPFPTALLAEHLGRPGAGVAAAVYSGMGLAISLAFTGVARHAFKDQRLLVRGSEEEVAILQSRYRYGPLGYVAAFGLAFVSAWASIGTCLALVLFFAFRGFIGKK